MRQGEVKIFRAHCGDEGAAPAAVLVAADSFESAALAFAEQSCGAGAAMQIVVVEEASGRRECFTVDLQAA